MYKIILVAILDFWYKTIFKDAISISYKALTDFYSKVVECKHDVKNRQTTEQAQFFTKKILFCLQFDQN